jgi:hypothetical protein
MARRIEERMTRWIKGRMTHWIEHRIERLNEHRLAGVKYGVSGIMRLRSRALKTSHSGRWIG